MMIVIMITAAFAKKYFFLKSLAIIMSKAAHKRLMKEYAAIKQNPPPYILARPSDKNILEWHYVITGPVDTAYQGLIKTFP